tara:strand:+ start:131 stop:598 length:468 start_codon:yes stop_codon:yes gene_type:complete
MEFEPSLTEREKRRIRRIKYKWNDLSYLQEYSNELGVNPTSLYEAWELLFPSLYPWIEEEVKKLTFEKLKELVEYKNSDYYFPRSSGYNTINDFSIVVSKVKFYGSSVDVYFDIFDVDFLYEQLQRRREKEELFRLYIKNKNLSRDVFKYIREYI